METSQPSWTTCGKSAFVKAPLFLAALAPILLGVFGCSTVQRFEDVSDAPAYRAYVGATFRLEVAMHLSGVNAPPGYGQTVDYYVVHPTSPSWSGPELITRDLLPAGTELNVKAVRRCTNCLFDERFEAEISLPAHLTQQTRPIHIRLTHLTPELARKLDAER